MALPTDEPETFEERKQAAINVLADLSKWIHTDENMDDRTSGFSKKIDQAIERGVIPDTGTYRDGARDTYKWQIFVSTVADLAFEDREAILEYLREQQNAKNPITATDGSKGQWRAANKASILAAHWLLYGEEP